MPVEHKSKKNEVSMEKKPEIAEAQKGLEFVPISSPEMPVMIKFNEFLSSVSKSRKFLPETIGGFVAWMKREGVPKSLPFNRWKELLEKYSKRIV
jgi:hypothetical protein